MFQTSTYTCHLTINDYHMAGQLYCAACNEIADGQFYCDPPVDGSQAPKASVNIDVIGRFFSVFSVVLCSLMSIYLV